MRQGARFPLLFVAAAVVVAVVVALVMTLGDDDDRGGPEPTVATAPANVLSVPEQPPARTTGGVERRAEAGQASLTAGREQLLPLPEGGLAAFDGEDVVGQRLVVVEVGEDEFTVARAAGDEDRVRVTFDSSYAPKRDDRVDLRGVVDGTRVRAVSVVPEGAGRGNVGTGESSGGEQDHP